MLPMQPSWVSRSSPGRRARLVTGTGTLTMDQDPPSSGNPPEPVEWTFRASSGPLGLKASRLRLASGSAPIHTFSKLSLDQGLKGSSGSKNRTHFCRIAASHPPLSVD